MTPKYLLMVGLFGIAWCSVLFGLLVFAKNGWQFFILALIVRIAWSIGATSVSAAANLLGTLLYPNHIPIIYASTQIGAGAGLVAGPFFGGYLYELAGFPLPFITMACVCILSIIPLSFLIDNELRVKDQTQKVKSISMIQAIKQEIGKFTPSQTGQVFLITGLVYTFFIMLVSRIASRWSNAYFLLLVSVPLLIFSLLILGPMHGIPLEPNIYFVIISQVLLGIAMANIYVLSFDDFIGQAKICLPDTDQMIATVNGMYISSYGIGVFCGPFIAGRLIEDLGYRKSIIPMVLIMIALFILVAVYITKIRKTAIKDKTVP